MKYWMTPANSYRRSIWAISQSRVCRSEGCAYQHEANDCAGSKMSKSLKNFQTIQDALATTYTARNMRIVFLMGRWNDGVEISPDMRKQADNWESTVDVSSGRWHFISRRADRSRTSSQTSKRNWRRPGPRPTQSKTCRWEMPRPRDCSGSSSRPRRTWTPPCATRSTRPAPWPSSSASSETPTST